MRVNCRTFSATVLACCITLVAFSSMSGRAWAAETKVTTIDEAIGAWAWRGVGDPLVVGRQSMFLFGLDEGGGGAKALHLNWADNTATSRPISGLVLDKNLRYSSAQTSAGVWLVGPSIALLRPDGLVLHAPLRVDRPPVVGLADGSILVFKDQEQQGSRQILSVRLAPDRKSLEVSPRARLSFDGQPNESGQYYREPEYGHGAVALADGRVLMFGDSRTPKLASVFDPETARMTPVAPMPHERSLAAAARLSDGRVVVAGAKHLSCYDSVAREVDVYDVKANTWTTLPRLPLPLCAEAYGAWRPSLVEASDGSLVLGGGLEPELMVLGRDKQSASGFARVWKRVGYLPVPRIGGVVQALPDHRLVVAGGVHNSQGFGGCCQRTVGVDRVSLTESPAAFGPGGLAMNGPGVALRGHRLFVVGGRRFVTTGSGQMRYGSQAEVLDLKTGISTQLDAVPVIAGAMDAVWLDDDRVLVKGRLASSDRGFDENLSSYMPEGSAAMAIYQFSTASWTRLDLADLGSSQMLGIHDGVVLFLNAAGGLQTWRVGDGKPAPGPATIGSNVGGVRMLSDARIVLASNLAPSDIVSVLDESCDDLGLTCKERFVALGPMMPASLYEVVKLGDPGFHLAVRNELGIQASGVSHAIDLDGRVARLRWVAGADDPTAPGMTPGWHIQRTSTVGGDIWEPLPLPSEWREQAKAGDHDCGSGVDGTSQCQLLALSDPRDPSGKRTLLFLRSTTANRDWNSTDFGKTKVWWFNESRRAWQLALEVEGLPTRHGMFELPQSLFPGDGRLRSIGWHLAQPVLWVD